MDSINRKLLEKFFRKECTVEEMRLVIRWLKDPDNRDEVEALLRRQWDEAKDVASPDSNLDKIYENILYEISTQEQEEMEEEAGTRRLFSRRTYLGIAATLLILITSSLLIMKLKLAHRDDTAANVIKKTTQQGEKLTVQLPDGTIATLNSGSQIEFPESFSDHDRKISLTGEAYFDVAKDASRPFTVTSNEVSVTALGTAFNVNAFDESGDVKVTLLVGKVRVDERAGNTSTLLDPGESAVFSKDNGVLKKVKVDASLAVLWKEGILYFDRTDFRAVVKELGRWYGVSFDVENMPSREPVFFGSFQNATLDNVLKSMGFALGFEYEINNRTVTINFKKPAPMRKRS